MAKQRTVKWAVEEPEDLADFKTNDDIVAQHGLPPKGPTNLRLVSIQETKNKNDERSWNVMVAIDGGKWDGYTMFEWQNITKQGAPYLKRFLNAIGVPWSDFTQKCVVEEDPERDGKEYVVRLGSLKVKGGKKPVTLRGSLKVDNREGFEERMKVARWMPAGTTTAAEDEATDAEADAAVDMSVDEPKGKKSKKDKGKKGKSKKQSDDPPF